MTNKLFRQDFSEYKNKSTVSAISRVRELTDDEIDQKNIKGRLDATANEYCFEVAVMHEEMP